MITPRNVRGRYGVRITVDHGYCSNVERLLLKPESLLLASSVPTPAATSVPEPAPAALQPQAEQDSASRASVIDLGGETDAFDPAAVERFLTLRPGDWQPSGGDWLQEDES